MMKKFEFINRVWVQNSPRNKLLRKILLICGGLLAGIALIQILMGGIKDVNWITGILLPAVMIIQSFLFTSSGRYIAASIEMTIETDWLMFVYPDIDRLNKLGNHSETIIMNWEDIFSVQYSKELESIRIVAMAMVKIESESKNEVASYGENNPYELIIYPQKEEIGEIVRELESYVGEKTTHME